MSVNFNDVLEIAEDSAERKVLYKAKNNAWKNSREQNEVEMQKFLNKWVAISNE